MTRRVEELLPLEVELKPVNEEDLVRIQAILSDAARWMRDELGVLNQWPERFPDRVILEAIRARDVPRP